MFPGFAIFGEFRLVVDRSAGVENADLRYTARLGNADRDDAPTSKRSLFLGRYVGRGSLREGRSRPQYHADKKRRIGNTAPVPPLR